MTDTDDQQTGDASDGTGSPITDDDDEQEQ